MTVMRSGNLIRAADRMPSDNKNTGRPDKAVFKKGTMTLYVRDE